MGFIRRKKSGKKIDGSKLIVPGQGIKTSIPGGGMKSNSDQTSSTGKMGLRGKVD